MVAELIGSSGVSERGLCSTAIWIQLCEDINGKASLCIELHSSQPKVKGKPCSYKITLLFPAKRFKPRRKIHKLNCHHSSEHALLKTVEDWEKMTQSCLAVTHLVRNDLAWVLESLVTAEGDLLIVLKLWEVNAAGARVAGSVELLATRVAEGVGALSLDTTLILLSEPISNLHKSCRIKIVHG